VPWSGCPNNNVFSNRLNRQYDKLKSAFRKSDGKLFQTLVAAAAEVLTQKQLDDGEQSALSCLRNAVVLRERR